MDILEILKESINRLPSGEYTVGLTAVVRHLDCAIRHYQRDPTEDADCYTDSIYRTNQAYEGSVKEAYRVIAEKDPTRKRPHEIEGYLESHNILRNRVLTQLTRYRQDYRNPSAHDYRLDFDSNEALLAIVSVAAFSKLLVDQISEKIAFNASSIDGNRGRLQRLAVNANLVEDVAGIIRDICNEDDMLDANSQDFAATIAGNLVNAGMEANFGSDSFWDVVAELDGKQIIIESRIGDNRHRTSHMVPASLVASGVESENVAGGIIVTRLKRKGNYTIHEATRGTDVVHIVSKMDKSDLVSRLGTQWKIVPK